MENQDHVRMLRNAHFCLHFVTEFMSRLCRTFVETSSRPKANLPKYQNAPQRSVSLSKCIAVLFLLYLLPPALQVLVECLCIVCGWHSFFERNPGQIKAQIGLPRKQC